MHRHSVTAYAFAPDESVMGGAQRIHVLVTKGNVPMHKIGAARTRAQQGTALPQMLRASKIAGIRFLRLALWDEERGRLVGFDEAVSSRTR
jgi:hypothetical protein